MDIREPVVVEPSDSRLDDVLVEDKIQATLNVVEVVEVADVAAADEEEA